MEEGSDYTSAESSDTSDVFVGEDEKGYSDYELNADDEIRSAGESVTELPILGASKSHHKKKKSRSISIKNAFRRGRNTSKALDDLRRILEDAIQSNLLLAADDIHEDPTEIRIWGIPLLPSKGHRSTDTILLKFLSARDWKVPDAYEMLYRTLAWRKREKIDGILDEKLSIGIAAEKMAFTDRTDREGRPICFNLYGALDDADLFKALLRTESRDTFLRWRIQILERIIRTEFNFQPPTRGESHGSRGRGAVVSLIQISDLKNFPARAMAELASVGKKMLRISQEHYPDIVYKNIILNPPSWFNTVQDFLHQHCSAGTRKKFIVVASHSRITSRLLKYIEPQNIPVQYGGLKLENDAEFAAVGDGSNVFETFIKGGQNGTMEIPAREVHVTMVWDVMVVGWGVMYKEEFVPDDEGSYQILLRKEGRKGETVRSSYYISEPGTIVISIRNSHFRRKKVFWRYKSKPTLPAYVNN